MEAKIRAAAAVLVVELEEKIRKSKIADKLRLEENQPKVKEKGSKKSPK